MLRINFLTECTQQKFEEEWREFEEKRKAPARREFRRGIRNDYTPECTKYVYVQNEKETQTAAKRPERERERERERWNGRKEND